MVVKVTGGKGSTDASNDSAKAKGAFAHAEGSGTIATGDLGSHAEGSGTSAFGAASHAEGIGSTAVSNGSHAEGNGCSASNVYAHAEGDATTASGHSSHAEGAGTTASASQAHAEGFSTQATGTQAHSEGTSTRATGNFSHAGGDSAVASRLSQWARSSGAFGTLGDAQTNVFVARRSTNSATPSMVAFDGSSGATTSGAGTNVVTLSGSRAVKFVVDVIAARTDVPGEVAGWELSGVIARESGNVRLVGAVVGRSWGDSAAAAWDVTITADTTGQYLKIAVTGEAGKTIQWVARVETTEVAW